jgi:hypothetical protein
MALTGCNSAITMPNTDERVFDADLVKPLSLNALAVVLRRQRATSELALRIRAPSCLWRRIHGHRAAPGMPLAHHRSTFSKEVNHGLNQSARRRPRRS